MENLLFIAIIVVKSVFDYYEQFALESIFLHQLHIPTSFVSKKFNFVERKAPFLHLWSQKLGGSIFI